jgi:alcohol dehydrogenase class IV
MNATSSLQYEFAAPQRIVFGWGRRKDVGRLTRTLGRRAFLISGSRAFADLGIVDGTMAAMRSAGVDAHFLETIEHEPEVEDVDRVANTLRSHGAWTGDVIVAIGGGAAIDLAKATAAMATNSQSVSVKDYLEGVGLGLKLVEDPLAVMALPTTAGTGAEATKNAVISSYDPPFKKSLRDERLVPRIALVDPELTVSLPPLVTAASGMDAITQLLESYLSRKAQPIPQTLAIQGLCMAVPALAEAVENGASQRAREMMSHAALLSGMALANSGLGMAHGVAAALGVHARVPHGLACALMLPTALRVNRQARRAEMAQIAQLLFDPCPTHSPDAAVDVLIEEIEKLCDRVKVPRKLSQLGVAAEQIPAIARDSRGSSMSGNPQDISDDELTRLLEDLL